MAWGLLETKRGFRARAKARPGLDASISVPSTVIAFVEVLAERAATLDGNKAKAESFGVNDLPVARSSMPGSFLEGVA